MTVQRPAACLTPAQRGDALFFGSRRTRRFRARPFEQGDFVAGLPACVALFSEDGGSLAEIDLVIVKRLPNGRQRKLFASAGARSLRTDRAIIAFLRSQGVKPGRGLASDAPMTPNRFAAETYSKFGVSHHPGARDGQLHGLRQGPLRAGWLQERHRSRRSGWPVVEGTGRLQPSGCPAELTASSFWTRIGTAPGMALRKPWRFLSDTESIQMPCQWSATPRDGRHFIFRRPEGLGDTKGKIAQAIDVRDNAYVIAAGSVMTTGQHYALHAGTVPQLAGAIAALTLPALPQALCDLIAKPISRPSVQSARSPMPPQPVSGGQHGPDPRPRLAGLIRTVATSGPGHRNATLHWAACRAGELISAGLLPSGSAVIALVEAGLMAGLPGREAVATVRSGISTSLPEVGRGR